MFGMVHPTDSHPLAGMSRHVALASSFEYGSHRDLIVPAPRLLLLGEYIENVSVLQPCCVLPNWLLMREAVHVGIGT